MAASDDDVRKKKPRQLEKDFNKFKAAEVKAAREQQLGKLIEELKKTEVSFLTPLANFNSQYQGFINFLSESNPAMGPLLKELSDAAATLHQDYPAKFFDVDENLSVEGYQDYLSKLSDISTKSASLNKVFANDLEFQAKAYNRLHPKDAISVSSLISVVSLPFQRGPRHELLMGDIIRNSEPTTKMHDNASAILELVKKSNVEFDEIINNIPPRTNADVIKFMMDARSKLMNIPKDPRAVKMIAQIEELVRKDVDHQLSYSDLNSVFTKRDSIILVKNPLDKLVENILNSPEMKRDRQSVTRGSDTPKAETPAVAKSSVCVNDVTPNASKPTTTERSSSNLSHEKLKTIIVSLYATGWTPNALPEKSNATMPIEIKKEGDSFIITPDKLTTSSSSVETYKAMLQAFNAVNPNKEPKITTNNPVTVKAWQQAYKETFPGKPVPTNLVEVKIAKEPVAPKAAAPEEQTAPSPK
jgi:hypothetical protein